MNFFVVEKLTFDIDYYRVLSSNLIKIEAHATRQSNGCKRSNCMLFQNKEFRPEREKKDATINLIM